MNLIIKVVSWTIGGAVGAALSLIAFFGTIILASLICYGLLLGSAILLAKIKNL